MKAVECTGYGSPEVLRLTQVEKPTPRADEVLVRVVATTVHVGDVRIRTFDVPRGQRVMARLVLGVRRPRHPILGMELAGVVESVGRDVTLFTKGDEGVGTYAVQLAKFFGATVTGVCSTTKVAMVRSLGADRVIDYTHQDFTQDQETYDVILDAVDKLDPSRGKGRLNPRGVYLNIVKDSGSAGGVTTEDLTSLTRLVEDGRIRAVIDRRYPMEQIVEAHRYVEQGHKMGHVIITVAAAGSGEA